MRREEVEKVIMSRSKLVVGALVGKKLKKQFCQGKKNEKIVGRA